MAGGVRTSANRMATGELMARLEHLLDWDWMLEKEEKIERERDRIERDRVERENKREREYKRRDV